MKRGIIFSLMVLVLAYTNAFAGGSGNPIEPLTASTEHVGIGGTFGYNYVHERANTLDNDYGPKDMEVTRLSQVYGKITLGHSDNFNVYGKIGGNSYDLKFVDSAQGAEMEIDFKDGVYTGAGINALFPIKEIADFTIGLGTDFQANFFYNEVENIRRAGENATGIGGAFYGVDGENSVYLTCKYDIEPIKTAIIPYIGAYHSWIFVGTAKALSYDTTIAGNVEDEHFQAASDLAGFGFMLGLDLDIAKYAALSIEGRFGGETAVTTGATVKF